eukprot:scaffold11791_cov116-Isochrysis_galbana.AAC.3
MKGDAAIQEPLVFDAGMTYFPQYNFLLTPFMLYGVPALYLVLAVTGHFAMRRMSTCADASNVAVPAAASTWPLECHARPCDSPRMRLHRACSTAPGVTFSWHRPARTELCPAGGGGASHCLAAHAAVRPLPAGLRG